MHGLTLVELIFRGKRSNVSKLSCYLKKFSGTRNWSLMSILLEIMMVGHESIEIEILEKRLLRRELDKWFQSELALPDINLRVKSQKSSSERMGDQKYSGERSSKLLFV